MPPTSRRPRSRQAELFPRSKRASIEIAPNHRLAQITEEIDWTELEELVQAIRLSKLKNAAGRPPHLRALIGALVFRALRHRTYREVEDLIRYYAPARLLCGLTETDWSPDANTIQDFEQLLGEDGVKLINEHVVKWAVEEELADPTVVVADTTAQEAAIPYPNEMNMMATFVSAVAAASKHVGTALQGFVKRAGSLFQLAKKKLREFRLFAKDKAKAVRMKLTSTMANIVEQVQDGLEVALDEAARQRMRLTKSRKVAWAKLGKLQETMATLLPQIRYWIKTGWVAANKVVSLQIPEIYSIVRGKVGKNVEFGLKWGMTRLRGGFVLATLGKDKNELVDSAFAVRAAKDTKALFGKAPKAYAYDRAGWSAANVAELKQLGVREVGLAPPGQGEVAGRGQGQGQAGFGALTSRGMHRVGEVTKVWVQQARCEIGGGDGGVRTPLRLGIQPQQADERGWRNAEGWCWSADQLWTSSNEAASGSGSIAAQNNDLRHQRVPSESSQISGQALALNQALPGHQNCSKGTNKSRAHESLLRVRPDSSPRRVLMKLLPAGLLLSELTYPRRSAPGGYC